MMRVLAAALLASFGISVTAQEQVQTCTPDFLADTMRLFEDGRLEAVGNVELRLCNLVAYTDRAEIRPRPGQSGPTLGDWQATQQRIESVDDRVLLSGGVILVAGGFEVRAQEIEMRRVTR